RFPGRFRSPGGPAARSSRRSDEDTSSPPVARRASPLFSQEILQRGIVEHGIGQHPLQPAVLVLQRPQPLAVGYIETAELGLPFIERRRADPVFATDLCCRYPGLLFPQHRDDLLFREPSSLHRPSLSFGPDSSFVWTSFRGSRHSHELAARLADVVRHAKHQPQQLLLTVYVNAERAVLTDIAGKPWNAAFPAGAIPAASQPRSITAVAPF